jgi:hypothetical protein
MKDFLTSFLPLLGEFGHFSAANFSRPTNIIGGTVLSYLAENSAIWQQ